MKFLFRYLTWLLLVSSGLMAGTVVITSVPDEQHLLDPLTSLGGIPLASGVEIQVGAFPGMSDDDLLDAAATGGLAQIESGFSVFGAPFAIGDGVDGAAGSFEVAVKQSSGVSGATWIGGEISLLIKPSGGSEFLVARFKNQVFQADPETGLESLVSLHLADAKLIVGNRFSSSRFATSIAPESASFHSWIKAYSSITDPAMRLQNADADGDGRSNFLEYATGGDPDSSADSPACELVQGEDDTWWIRFARESGIGSIEYEVESSADFVTSWQALEGNAELDPSSPSPGNPIWMRIPVPSPLNPSGFFRLNVQSGDD